MSFFNNKEISEQIEIFYQDIIAMCNQLDPVFFLSLIDSRLHDLEVLSAIGIRQDIKMIFIMTNAIKHIILTFLKNLKLTIRIVSI